MNEITTTKKGLIKKISANNDHILKHEIISSSKNMQEEKVLNK